MRIMTVLGGPRRHGNTAKVLGWIEEQFRGDGHDADPANILDYNVQGCGECMACKRETPVDGDQSWNHRGSWSVKCQ